MALYASMAHRRVPNACTMKQRACGALAVMVAFLGAPQDIEGRRQHGSELRLPAAVGELAAVQPYANGVALLSRSGARLFFRGRDDTVEAIGARGFGPGEYASPVALGVGLGGYLLLLDSQRTALTWYRRGSQGWRAVASTDAVGGESLCTFANHIVVLGGASEHLLTEYRVVAPAQLAKLRSFGQPVLLDHPNRTHPIVMSLVASGHVACSPDGAWVAHVDRSFGEVRFFDAKRNMSAHVRLKPFNPLSVRAEGATVVSAIPASGQFDETLGLVALDETRLVISVARKVRTASGSITVHSYRLVELSANGELLRDRKAEGVLGGVTGGRALCYTATGPPSLFESTLSGLCRRK